MSLTRDVAVIIPTLRRPESLARAIRSVQGQENIQARLREVIVVDNDPKASAQQVVERLAAASDLSIVWCHAPVPGVATARNRGLAETTAPLIAFLDDDEVASPNWLDSLLATYQSLKADVIFGPIQGRVPQSVGWTRDYLEGFFSRLGPDQDQELEKAFGCGNSLLVRETALPGQAPFDTNADQSGGEDDALFSDLALRGGRFGWSASAWVDEHAPAHRATLNYALHRAFAYGQGPSQIAANHRQWSALARWMVIGAGQALIYGAASILLAIIRHPQRIMMYDRTLRGAGKLFWMKRFVSQFYGTQELKRLDQTARPKS